MDTSTLSIFMHLFFFITSILYVSAQSTLSSTIATSSAIASESATASSSSQMVWRQKSGCSCCRIRSSWYHRYYSLLFLPFPSAALSFSSSFLNVATLLNFTSTNNFVKPLPNVPLILQTYPFFCSNLEVRRTPTLEAPLIQIG
jgi:hypothetical protein